MNRNMIESLLDSILVITIGATALQVFIGICFQDIVSVYEDNLFIRYSELILSGLILAYGIYRLGKKIKWLGGF